MTTGAKASYNTHMKTHDQELMLTRISNKGIRARDIKVQGLLTDDDIANVEVGKVYEWVRTGQWRARDFNRWLKVLRVIE